MHSLWQTQIPMQLYTVEQIIGKRLRRGMVEYKVKWQGYSDDDCTWQPFKNLKYVEDMVNAYEEANNNQPQEIEERQDHNFEQDFNDNNQNAQEEDEQRVVDNEENEQFQQQEQEEQVEELSPENYYQAKNEKRKEAQDGDLNEGLELDIDIESLSFGEEETNNKQDNPILQNFENSAPRKMCQIQRQRFKYPRQKLNIQKIPQKISKVKEVQLPRKSYLQDMEERTRFIVKTPPKEPNIIIPRVPRPGELKVIQMSRCDRTNQLIYLTQFGPIICYRTQSQMRSKYPDDLIRFYEGRIEFEKIPKLSK